MESPKDTTTSQRGANEVLRNETYLLGALESTRRRLLDLTRRNRLLNYREAARDIAIVEAEPDEVFALLGDDKSFQFLALPDDDEDSTSTPLARRGESRRPSLPRRPRGGLQTPYPLRDLERRLRRLHGEFRSSLEETGANSLFLAMGFLHWTDGRSSSDEDDSTPSFQRSPLMLVPVRLDKGLGREAHAYSLRSEQEALDTNYSLSEKLRSDLGIVLPQIGEQTTPEAYWADVERAIRSRAQEGWHVIPEITLGLFRFQKQVLWHDLDPDRWPKHANLTDKPLVRRILLGNQETDTAPGQLSDQENADEFGDGRSALSLILDADTSQLAALFDALDREDGLVVEGPPGTGKSQTITNLIAAAMDRGLSVLFVAEKMAALDVVFERLKAAKLDDFCLQLHGLRISKRDMLDSLLARFDRRARNVEGLERQRASLHQTRASLLDVSKKLSALIGPARMPLHQAVWHVERLRQKLPDGWRPTGVQGAEQTEWTQLQSARQLLSDLGREWNDLPPEVREHWSGFEPAPGQEETRQTLEASVAELAEVGGGVRDWLHNSGLAHIAHELDNVATLVRIANAGDGAFPSFPDAAPSDFAHDLFQADRLTALDGFCRDVRSYLDDVAEVSKYFDFSASDVETHVRLLERHSSNLREGICAPDTPLHEIRAERDRLDDLLTRLRRLPSHAAPVLDLTGELAGTLSAYAGVAKTARKLADGPSVLSLHGSAMFSKRSVANCRDRAKLRRDELLLFVENYLPLFEATSLGTTEELKTAVDGYVAYRQKWFPSLRRHFREGRAYLRSLMRAPGLFSTGDGFNTAVERLVRFAEDRDAFAGDTDFRLALGSLFDGLATRWTELDQGVDFGQRLAKRVGPEKAGRILGDWDAHVDNMETAAQALESDLETIEGWRAGRPPRNALWERPVTQIIGELEPWLRKLDEAADALLQDWCNTAMTLTETAQALHVYQSARRKEAAIEAQPNFDGVLRSRWQREHTSLTPLQPLRDWAHVMRHEGNVPARAFKWLLPTREGLDRARLDEMRATCRRLRDALGRNTALLGRHGTVDKMLWCGGSGASLGCFHDKMAGCAASGMYLPVLERWNNLRARAENQGLQPFSNLLAAGELGGGQVADAFEASLYCTLLDERFRQDRELASFAQGQYENLRESFVRLDKEHMGLVAQEIGRRLCTVGIPSGSGHGPVSTYSDRALILHEANKRKRHIPVRQLMRRAGTAVQAAKPCFLMSPMSVAQYLPPDVLSFDLVVMDEASQIRPEDALGAIARGRKVVIVGDPKQLPPTRFFDALTDEDENAEETTLDDTESILDLTLKKLPFRRLRWHYRSQHEALIQFSNEQFYDGDLLVFPSPRPTARDLGVHFHLVKEPSYKQGRNRGEAVEIVEGVVRELRSGSRRTVGVVAFNKRQAEEIELLLDRVRQRQPDLEPVFAGEGLDAPLFVKNLENVQGDERDVIFISTTYGPESADGPVAQRFGPINSEVGWRRLNVIATRARQRVEIYSSMRPTDVRIGEGARRGVTALRAYLEYASTGRVVEQGRGTGKPPESDFEVAVAKLIIQLGFEVEPQVGVAGFFIDLGVKHPDRPGEFLMGVECDGAAYHSSLSVRDRDRLRQEILEGKGWHIHRVWSTSWFHARGAEIDRLRRAIEARLTADRVERPAPPPAEVPAEPFEHGTEETEAAPADTAGLFDEANDSALADLLSEPEAPEEDLEGALNRFWESNIKPHFPDRSRSLLSPEIVAILVREMPITRDEWLRHVPTALRMKVDSREGNYISDVLALIEDYV